MPRTRRTILNVGCGPRHISIVGVGFGTGFPETEWEEIRLDIDSKVEPDIVASMTDMAPVPDASVDAVWSSHNLEHLYAHEVPAALGEFLRVLRPGGMLLLSVPDLQTVAAIVAEDRVDDPLYVSEAGPITPFDIIFGYGKALAKGNSFMAHRTGFTPNLLARLLQAAGFGPILIWRPAGIYELRVRAFRPPAPPDALAAAGIGPGAFSG